MSIKINLRVPEDWKKRTEKEAKRKGVSLSEYLRTAADRQEKEVEGALIEKSDKEADGVTVVSSTYFVRCCRVEFTCYGAAYAQRCPVCGGRIKNVSGKDASRIEPTENFLHAKP